MWLSAATSSRRSISDVFGSFFHIYSERFYHFIHSLVGFSGFVFWGFHFRALFEFPIFTTLYLFSLSPFPLDLFLSTTSFLRWSPRIRTPLWRNPQLYWKGSLSRGYCCFGQFYAEVIFLQTLSTHKCSVPLEIWRRSQTNFTRDIYHNNQIIYFFGDSRCRNNM